MPLVLRTIIMDTMKTIRRELLLNPSLAVLSVKDQTLMSALEL